MTESEFEEGERYMMKEGGLLQKIKKTKDLAVDL